MVLQSDHAQTTRHVVSVIRRVGKPTCWLRPETRGGLCAFRLLARLFESISKLDPECMKTTATRGFIQIPVLIAILISAAVFGGGGYFVAHEMTKTSQNVISATTTAQATSTDILRSEKQDKVVTKFEADKATNKPASIFPSETEKKYFADAAKKVQPLGIVTSDLTEVGASQEYVDPNASAAAFNYLMSELYKEAEASRQQAANEQEKKQLECLMQPTPPEERTLSPQQQQYLREQRCGTATVASEQNYKLYQEQKYQECIAEHPSNFGSSCNYLKPVFY